MWFERENRKKIRQRSRQVVAFLMMALVLLFCRMAYLQIIDGSRLAQMNQRQIEENKPLQSPRGAILDTNGRVLAASSVTKSLYADPKMLNKSPEAVAKLLAPYLNIKESEIIGRLKGDTSFIWLERMLDRDISDEVSSVIKVNDLKGLNFVEESKRYYPNGDMAAQVIGFVGVDDKGLDGVEMLLDKEIRGDIRKQKIITDGKSVPIFGSALAQFIPDKERSVYLTIDTAVQFAAEQALDKVMTENRPTGASVIVMNPKSGEILAMASRPTYDPNHYERGSETSFKNRGVNNLYEPGSTFKPIVAATALATGKWKENEVFNDVGYVAASGHQISNWNDSAYGEVTLQDILKFSINTGMAHIGLQVGGDLLTAYAEKFGFGKPTGIELPGEGAGILFNPAEMGSIDIASMSIGQAVAVTPLQMVQAFGALANDGKMMKPYIIKSIMNADGSVYRETEVQKVGEPVSQEVAHAVSKILEQEISTGGGNKAKIEGYEFCGKTGTAQKLNESGTGYAEGRYIASFVGYGPIDDPQFVVLIVIDDPAGVYYGGQIAAPVFHDIMSRLVRYKGIHPTVRKEYTGSEEIVARPIPAVQKDVNDTVIVPAFYGWNMRDVGNWLEQAGLGFVPTGSGVAVSQDPPAGGRLKPGNDVQVDFKR